MHKSNFYSILSLMTLFMMAQPIAAQAATSGGIDTPDGKYELPLSVLGTPGVNISIPTGSPAGTVPDTEVLGNATFNQKVGIGTTAPVTALDVAGAIRSGSSDVVKNCGPGAANGEGSQRYNYQAHVLEFCNGTAWVSVAKPGHLQVVNAGNDVSCYSMVATMNVAAGLSAGDPNWAYLGAGVLVGGNGSWTIFVNQRNDCSPMSNISRGTGFIARDGNGAIVRQYWSFSP